MTTLSIGVLALQGSFSEHVDLLNSLAPQFPSHTLEIVEVRTAVHLARVQSLIIPGGESTAISLIAQRTNLIEPLRDFVKEAKGGRKAIWGTCAGMILVGQEVVGGKEGADNFAAGHGMDVRVVRNQWGRQVSAFVSIDSNSFDQYADCTTHLPLYFSFTSHSQTRPTRSSSKCNYQIQSESFTHPLSIDCLSHPTVPFSGIFIRAPVMHSLLDVSPNSPPLEILARVPREILPVPKVAPPPSAPASYSTPNEKDSHGSSGQVLLPTNGNYNTASSLGPDADIVMAKQGNLVVSSFHPELTGDARVHEWFVREVVLAGQAV